MTSRKAPMGILGFPVTPINADGKINEVSLSRNIQFLIDEGLEAIFVACGAGEFHAIDRKEYEAIVEIAVSVTNGKVPVYTGVGGNITNALEFAEISAKKGADGYLIFPPYLIEGEQEGIYNYFHTIISSTNLNAITYQRGNVTFTPQTLSRLADLPQMIGMKDGLGNMELNVELTQTIGDRIGWLNGMPLAEVMLPTYVPLGFESYSSAISNYIPHISRQFYDALLQGDQKKVNDLYRVIILPINQIRKQRKGYAVSLIKAGMEIMGMPAGKAVRPPVTPVEKEHYKELESIIYEAMKSFPKTVKSEI